MSLYFSGKDAYNSGHYYDAQRYFQNALIKNPDIEAMAPNIKYMLGVSAFNNNDYKTANTYLSLFPENPIAKDLLSKIKAYEETLPEEFLYHNTVYTEPVNEATKSILQTASSTVVEETAPGINPTILLAAISVLILAVGLFLEIKINTFSKLALKLVGVSPDFLSTHHSTVVAKSRKIEESEETRGVEDGEGEINVKVLLDTPFDEEIDIDEMASKDISELTKFFGNDEPLYEEEEPSQNIKASSEQDQLNMDDFNDARSSILNSVLDEEESELDDTAEPETEPSYTPKYEHLDNIPDDFDVNSAISKAYNLIEKIEKTPTSENGTPEQWTSIDEYTNSLDEQDRHNVNYFQNLEAMDDEDLNKYYDFIFEKHSKEKTG
ncbi:MAG TPA: tetratricopeptide repeat protein [Thermotogota bacterium]|nr:tetratricopeptide repeat protein [Thermotogota bacterium]HPJ87874.1 tetratricopeptide repeat protein [Thermotogota bacterium]HPR94967.1 tetratricopeptide repeat protein [Thermotogota bacterium]